jgi:hypothetical protein
MEFQPGKDKRKASEIGLSRRNPYCTKKEAFLTSEVNSVFQLNADLNCDIKAIVEFIRNSDLKSDGL